MKRKYVIIVLLGVLVGGVFFVLQKNTEEQVKSFTEDSQTQNTEQTKEIVPPPIDSPQQATSNKKVDVPFTVQAPFAEWSDSHFQNACEEASLLMIAYWFENKPLTKNDAKESILKMESYEEKKFGTYIDTSLADTQTILSEYLNIPDSSLQNDITKEDIVRALEEGNVVILPADGRKLQNPNFRQPGPPRHMLVVTGYDPESKEFITNDPGTRNGKNYRYKEDVLFSAILDYPTGDHIPATSVRKNMLLVKNPD